MKSLTLSILILGCRSRTSSELKDVFRANAYFWAEGDKVYRGECPSGFEPHKKGRLESQKTCTQDLAVLPMKDIAGIRDRLNQAKDLGLMKELGLDLLQETARQDPLYQNLIKMLDDFTSADVLREVTSAEEIDFMDRVFHGRAVLITIEKVAAGRAHTCALMTDDNLKCWGDNEEGQLGTGHTVDVFSAKDAQTVLKKVKDATAGSEYTCAILLDDSLKCWGWNVSGQLGTYDLNLRSAMQAKPILSNVKDVAIYLSHTCALMMDHSMKCWGRNEESQLGTNKTDIEYIAGKVQPILQNVKQVAVGRDHSCALMMDHSLKCWGANGEGQLGTGNFEWVHIAAKAQPVLKNVRAVALGRYHTCALLMDHSLKCWGVNSDGQLGTGDTKLVPSAAKAQLVLKNVKEVVAGIFHTCAILLDDSLKCWGWNGKGQLGVGNIENVLSAAEAKPILKKVKAVALGGYSTCAVLMDSSLKCWGDNEKSQLGFVGGNYGDEAGETLDLLKPVFIWRRADLAD